MDKSPIASSSISSIPSQSSSSNTSNAPVPSVETNAFTATPLDTSNPSEIASTDSDLRYLGYLGRIRALATAGSRYLAYTSDFGEAFRPVVGRRIVQTTYGISWAYVTLDVAYEVIMIEYIGKNIIYISDAVKIGIQRTSEGDKTRF